MRCFTACSMTTRRDIESELLSMSHIAQLQADIAHLSAAMEHLAAIAPDVVHLLEQQRAAKQAQLVALTQQTGGLHMGNGNRIDHHGDMFGGDKVLHDKVLQYFFGGQPGERGEDLLRDYLLCTSAADPRLDFDRSYKRHVTSGLFRHREHKGGAQQCCAPPDACALNPKDSELPSRASWSSQVAEGANEAR